MEGTKATVLKTDLNYASERLLDIKNKLFEKVTKEHILKKLKNTQLYLMRKFTKTNQKYLPMDM
jgi:hypothetical protein